MSLSSVAYCLSVLSSVNILALETTTEASHESMVRDFLPILKKTFNPTYILFRPLVLPEEQYIYDEWGTTCDEKNRATVCRLIIVSEAFRTFSKDDVSSHFWIILIPINHSFALQIWFNVFVHSPSFY